MVDGTDGVRDLLRALHPLAPQVRFGDFLKATVLLSAGAATLLAALTVISLTRDLEPLGLRRRGLVARGGGDRARLGRRAEANPPIARLLATRSPRRRCPDAAGDDDRQPPVALLVPTFVAGVIGFFLPQVAAVAAGFAIIWALGGGARNPRSPRSRSETRCASTSTRPRR
jgi:hypothetical protein